MKKIVILFSGEGSNLENLIEKLHNKTFNGTEIKIVAAITNNPNAKGIKKAQNLEVNTEVIDHKKFSNREEFDKELVKNIDELEADLTILAGFMRILSPVFTKNVKAINLHPSLLPLFKGADAIKRSFEGDEKKGGVSVHYVNNELDGGEIISQISFAKTPGMSYDEFSEKIKKIEYELLPDAAIKILT